MKYLKKLFLVVAIFFSFFALNTEIGFANSSINGESYQNPYKDANVGFQGGLNAIRTGIDDNINKKDGSVADYVQRVVIYLLSFVSLVAVIYIIYAGFRMMIFSSHGDEEAAGKTKKIILYVALGIIIMRLAYPILAFIIKVLNTGK